jgi:hypothetical protein
MPDDQGPQPKPNTPSPRKDPPGIAAGVIKKEGETPPSPADKARLDEELDGLENLPSAAGV